MQLSVHVVCCLLLKWVNIWLLTSTSTCFDGPQPKLGQRCNAGILICWWGQRSNINVKGHLTLSCKIGSKCENGLIWKVEVWLEPNLVYGYNLGPSIYSCNQRSYTKVKGHQRSSWKIGSKCKIHLMSKVEVWLELNFVYWYNVWTSTCWWGQRSQGKVKGHVRSTCKTACKCKFDICVRYLRTT